MIKMLNLDVQCMLYRFYKEGYITTAELIDLQVSPSTSSEGREVCCCAYDKYFSLRIYAAQHKFDFEVAYWYESDEFCIVDK